MMPAERFDNACPSCGEADPFACACPVPHGLAVMFNATTGLDTPADPPVIRDGRVQSTGSTDGAIERAYGLGWGVYPLTAAGLAAARAECAEQDRACDAALGAGTVNADATADGIPPAVVLVVDDAGDVLGGPVEDGDDIAAVLARFGGAA